jgi:tetratricopeptide (TPR) repeat protein
MPLSRVAVGALALVLLGGPPLLAGVTADAKPLAAPDGPPALALPVPSSPGGFSKASASLTAADAKPAASPPDAGADHPMRSFPAKLPMSGLAPSKLAPDLCLYRYRVSTRSPECQAFVDQGFGYFYSYVWMEAARSFETAVQYDPDCAMAWWGLSRSLEKWGKSETTKALIKAGELRDKAGHREQQLILARMQEKGLVPGVGDADARKNAAIATIDNMLAVYDDDEEAWFYRAHLACGDRDFGGDVQAVPFYKALLRVNPLNPGANHELLHFYETFRRPALGWINAENYIKSSPGIPHPFHMQAHLATRLGRWDKTADRSAHAIDLERAYHADMGVRAADDQQFSHHLEILLISLTHDGRFAEARSIKAESEKAGFRQWPAWFRLHLAERDWAEALKVVDHFRRSDKTTANYMAALIYLVQGDAARAAPEVESLRQAFSDKKGDPQLEYRLWETQGMLLCQTGSTDEGLKLLAKASERSKDDYGHHSWGNGAYFMEAWGEAALRSGRSETAEEAYLEALAHDPGSIRAPLGLQVLCEQAGRSEEAQRYAELAHHNWARADAGRLDAELASLREGRYAGPAGGTNVPAHNP